VREAAKIERLIAVVEGLADAKFVRKGEEYDATSAAKFLRGKWDWWKAEVKTAQDFVRLATGGNMGTGQPYFIKFKDGRTVRSSEFLGAELGKLEGSAAAAATQPSRE